MRCGQRFGDLATPIEGVIEGQGAAHQSLLQCFAVKELHDDVGRSIVEDTGIVDVHDVGVADGIGGPRFGDEAAGDLWIGGVGGRKHLDGGLAADAGMLGQIHLSHTPLSDEALDLVVADARPDHAQARIINAGSVVRNP